MGIEEYTKQIIVQSNPGMRVSFIDATSVAVIPAGGSAFVDILSPIGYIAQVKNMYITFPKIGSTLSGSQKITGWSGNGLIPVFENSVPYNATDGPTYMYGEFPITPNLTQKPSDPVAAYLMPSSIYYDEDSSFRVTFTNSTDRSDEGFPKTIRLWVLEQKIS